MITAILLLLLLLSVDVADTPGRRTPGGGGRAKTPRNKFGMD